MTATTIYEALFLHSKSVDKCFPYLSHCIKIDRKALDTRAANTLRVLVRSFLLVPRLKPVISEYAEAIYVHSIIEVQILINLPRSKYSETFCR